MIAVPCWSSWKTGISCARAALLDLEALRRADVLEVDAAERGLERGDDVDELVASVASISMSKTSMSANFLNRHALPSITGLPRAADVAEAEHRRAVRHHRDQVALRV
jgi:hypothetical protein